MNRYSKYFLQNSLWLDDGFCQYYLQDNAWGSQQILDTEFAVFNWAEDAEQWLRQCADYDPYMTLRRLRVFLANDCLEHFSVHQMSDSQVLREVARQLSRHAYPVVIEPRMGWAVQVDAATAEPVQPLSVEPAPDLDGLLADLKIELDALVAGQQKKSDAIEAQLATMSEAEKAAFIGKKTGGTIWDHTAGGIWDLVKSAPGAIWSAAKAFPGFYVGYLQTVWKVAQTPSKMAALATQALITGDMNPLQKEIDKIVDPVAHTYEQAVEYKSMLTILFNDQATYNLLYDFAQRYYNATHPIELAQMGVSAATDIIVTVILAIFSAGVGAVANVAAKSTRLVRMFKKLKKITTTIKKLAPNNKLTARMKTAAEKVRKKKKPKAAPTKGMPEVNTPKKLDKVNKKKYDADDKLDGPKTTTRLDSRHAEVSQGIAKRIGKLSPAQTSGDLDQLFKQAKVADVELKALTDDIAKSTNGKAVYPPGLKTKARAIEKINADYGGDASKLLDISRSSISFDSADDLYKALDKIDKRAEIVRIKDRFVKPAPGGYRDILVNIKQPNGHITELQLHAKQILDVKGGTGHKLYEQIREINGKAILENRPLSASELKLQNSLIKESEALYDNAFKGFLGK